MNDQIRKGSWLQSIGTNVNIPANQKMSLLCIECVKEEKKKIKSVTFLQFHCASPNLAKFPLELFERKHWGETLSSS